MQNDIQDEIKKTCEKHMYSLLQKMANSQTMRKKEVKQLQKEMFLTYKLCKVFYK